MSSETSTSTRQSKIQYLFMALIVVSAFVAAFSISRMLTNNDNDIPTASDGPGGPVLAAPPFPVRDFQLTSHTGDAIRFSDLRGKTTLMFFGYTHCPDVCPTTLADYTQVKAELGADADEVNFLFVSVDGTRDTPEVMAEYLAQYDEHFIGMTGSEDLLREMGAQFNLVFEADAINVGHGHEDDETHDLATGDEDYFVQHTSPSFLIDKNGVLQALYFYGTKPDIIATTMTQFMNAT